MSAVNIQIKSEITPNTAGQNAGLSGLTAGSTVALVHCCTAPLLHYVYSDPSKL